MIKLDSPDSRILEVLIDKYTLGQVINAITEICHAKAEHIRSAWQDRVTAQPWNRDGNKLEAVARRLENV